MRVVESHVMRTTSEFYDCVRD